MKLEEVRSSSSLYIVLVISKAGVSNGNIWTLTQEGTKELLTLFRINC